MKIRVDTGRVDKMFDSMTKLPDDVMEEAYDFLKSKTPIRSGNARSRTRLKGDEIHSNYPYAGRLDEGWSKQAPSGFTEPTIAKLPAIINKYTKRV